MKACIGGCGVSFEGEICPACRLPASAQDAARKAWQKAAAVINTTNVSQWAEKRKEFNLFIASLLQIACDCDGEHDHECRCKCHELGPKIV